MPAILDAIDKFSDGAWCEVELGGGLVDDLRDEVVEGAVWVEGAQADDAPVYLGEHLTLVGAHAVQGSAGVHGRDDECGAFLADPEADGRGVCHACEDVGHDDEAAQAQLLAVGTHEVGIACVGELQITSEVLHDN